MKALTAVKMAHFILKGRLETAERIIDATAGNGKDTLFLAENSLPNAAIQAFDIQQAALDTTRRLLEKHGLIHKVNLILDSHSNLLKYGDQPVDIIMFNLGYLPGAQHWLTTTAETTLTAVQAGMELLTAGGIITIAAYHGHQEGQRELEALQSFLESVPQSGYTVGNWRMVNQINRPPVLYVIEKLRGDIRERTTTY